jgi:hypothetical protein
MDALELVAVCSRSMLMDGRMVASALINERNSPDYITLTCAAEALQLLLSLVSGTTRVSSVQASK